MLFKDKSVTFAATLCVYATLGILLFLYNQYLDIGFTKSFSTSDIIGYITLMSAIFGGVFAYRILLATLDQKDVSFMPFLYILNVNFNDSGIEINYSNCGQGPAIDVYWVPLYTTIKLKDRNHHPEICKPDQRTGLQREWVQKVHNLKDALDTINNFAFELTCKDQAGNRYRFAYRKVNDAYHFVEVRKNGRLFVSK